MKGKKELRNRFDGYERRNLVVEVRADEDAGEIVMFIPYDQETDVGWFREIIRPGFFTRTIEDNDDVVSWYDHGRGGQFPLGRTTAEPPSLILSENKGESDPGKSGLTAVASPLDSPDVEYLRNLIRRKEINGASFAFVATRERWTEVKDEKPLRELLEGEVFDVSPVVFAQYDGSGIGLRSAEQVFKDHRSASGVQGDGDPGSPIESADGIAQGIDLLRCRLDLAFVATENGITEE